MSLPRSPMPSRTQPLTRTGGLARYAALARGSGLQRRTPIKPVSAKRAAENRARKAMIARLYPERPLCIVPWCFEWADDVHEPRFRSRLGSITDPENQIPVCRSHHDWIHAHPEEAAEFGLAVHSWDAPGTGRTGAA